MSEATNLGPMTTPNTAWCVNEKISVCGLLRDLPVSYNYTGNACREYEGMATNCIKYIYRTGDRLCTVAHSYTYTCGTQRFFIV